MLWFLLPPPSPLQENPRTLVHQRQQSHLLFFFFFFLPGSLPPGSRNFQPRLPAQLSPASPAHLCAQPLTLPRGFSGPQDPGSSLVHPPTGLLSPPMATALGGVSAHIQDGAPRSWERVTGGGEAAWAGPQIAGSRGPVAGRPRDPPTRPSPGPERWPRRTASSSGRGAPSYRGGEPRTLRGVGIGPKAFQILVPESRRLGVPPRPEAWCQGSPGWSSCQSEEPGQLGCGMQTGVWGRGTSAGRCLGTGCEGQWSWASCHGQSGLGGPPADRFRLCTELLRGLQQHGMGGCLHEGGWPHGLGSQPITFLSSLWTPQEF